MGSFLNKQESHLDIVKGPSSSIQNSFSLASMGTVGCGLRTRLKLVLLVDGWTWRLYR